MADKPKKYPNLQRWVLKFQKIKWFRLTVYKCFFLTIQCVHKEFNFRRIAKEFINRVIFIKDTGGSKIKYLTFNRTYIR